MVSDNRETTLVRGWRIFTWIHAILCAVDVLLEREPLADNNSIVSLVAILLIAVVAIEIFNTATSLEAGPMNTRVRRAYLPPLRQESATHAWR